MAIDNLVQKETRHGTATGVLFDSDEENFVVQHEFVRLSFHKREFESLLGRLNQSWQKYRRNHGTQ